MDVRRSLAQLSAIPLTVGLCLMMGVGAAPEVEARSLNDAVFSPEQAKTGRRVYRKYCQSCHEEEYFETVMAVWNGEPLSELFSVMAAIMPQNNPGSLNDQEYLDVLAYIMAETGYLAGEAPLATSDLREIQIQPPR